MPKVVLTRVSDAKVFLQVNGSMESTLNRDFPDSSAGNCSRHSWTLIVTAAPPHLEP